MNTKCQIDESKCDNCQENEFHFYCKACNEHLCIGCNKDIHNKGNRALHDRIEVSSRVKIPKSLSCKVHHGEEMRWFCKTCRHSICEECYDQNGAHKQHDVILCRTMANDLKSEVFARYIEVAESKKEPIINALKTLESMLYDIGVEGVKIFKTTQNDYNTKHVSSLERAMNDVKAHYAAIRHLTIQLEEIHLRQIEELAKAKSDAVMNHIKALHADLDQIANSYDAKEAMIASPPLEACASHSDVMSLLDDLEAHVASIEITMDSSIPVTMCTSDVLRVLEKSCHVGGNIALAGVSNIAFKKTAPAVAPKVVKDGKVKKEKAKMVEKSLVVLEVKPWEADTNLEVLWHEIIQYQQEGLQWGESFKLEPIAYGIMKLVMTATIVDSLVLLDDITDNIEALESWVQSVNVASMNKISAMFDDEDEVNEEDDFEVYKVDVVDEEDDFDDAPKKKMADHPFKIMDEEQPSTFVMDTWKKTYSNCEGNYKTALASFWDTFDAAGWSIWRGDYNYNAENKVLYTTCNLLGGFIQRTEKIRKWLFGTMTIRGTEGLGTMKITAFYLIRGQDIKPLIACNDDAEYYTWTKVSMPASNADKALIFKYWSSDTTLEGLPYLDRKVYK